MAEYELSRPGPLATAPPGLATLRRHFDRYLDWEDWLTLCLMLGAVLSVSATLEAGGWSRQMPPITLISLIAAVAALVLARSSLPAPIALLLALCAGALVVLWRTLEMAGPGDIGQRADNVYWRFDQWSRIAWNGGVSNDPLPFNVLVMALTWLGVFAAGWSIFRWNNAWTGLVPGAVTLSLDAALVGDTLTFAVVCYILFGLLLVMRTNLTSRMRRWRHDNTSYPPLISLTFLNFGIWILLTLLVGAWIAPTGPFTPPSPVQALANRLTSAGVHFVRLAGPLQTKKIIPVHDYTGVLPFQGSVNLGDRQVLAVKPDDPLLRGPLALRGATYDTYTAGGWEAAERSQVALPDDLPSLANKAIDEHKAEGELISLGVAVTARSVVGSVLFGIGVPLGSDRPLVAEVPESSVMSYPALGLSDDQAMAKASSAGLIPLAIERDDAGRPSSVLVFDPADAPAPDAVVVKPTQHLEKGQSYRITGFVSTASAEELRAAGRNYPAWVRERYLQLPDTLPRRVIRLARQLTRGSGSPYDMAITVRDFLRTRPVDYQAGDVPPGRDTVDYFLFERQRGYFDYHASAMVVLLRAAGVPARLAVGYVVDESDRDSGAGSYAVRDSDSYAWAEVYFPGYGWIPFNPSPDRPGDLRPTRQVPNAPEPAPLSEAPPPEPVGADPIFDIVPGAGTSSPALTSGQQGGRPYALWAVLATSAFAVLLFGAAAAGWRRSVAHLPYPQQLWEKTVRLAAWAGCPPEAGQTPWEYAGRLERAFRGVPGIQLLAEVYNRSRFGRYEPSPAERSELARLWPHLRGALLGGILRRPWRRRRG